MFFLCAPNAILKQIIIFFQKNCQLSKEEGKKIKKKLFVYCTLHNGFIQFPSVIFYLMLHVLFNYHIHTIHQRSLILMRP